MLFFPAVPHVWVADSSTCSQVTFTKRHLLQKDHLIGGGTWLPGRLAPPHVLFPPLLSLVLRSSMKRRWDGLNKRMRRTSKRQDFCDVTGALLVAAHHFRKDVKILHLPSKSISYSQVFPFSSFSRQVSAHSFFFFFNTLSWLRRTGRRPLTHFSLPSLFLCFSLFLFFNSLAPGNVCSTEGQFFSSKWGNQVKDPAGQFVVFNAQKYANAKHPWEGNEETITLKDFS